MYLVTFTKIIALNSYANGTLMCKSRADIFRSLIKRENLSSLKKSVKDYLFFIFFNFLGASFQRHNGISLYRLNWHLFEFKALWL